MGVNISGGTSPKRHLLNSVDAILKEFLDILFCYKSEFIKKYIIYESQKKSSNYILSSSIPRSFYEKWLEFLTKGCSNLEEMRLEEVDIYYSHFKQKEELKIYTENTEPMFIYIFLSIFLSFKLSIFLFKKYNFNL